MKNKPEMDFRNKYDKINDSLGLFLHCCFVEIIKGLGSCPFQSILFPRKPNPSR